MSAADDYLNWRRGPPIACSFARLMSSKPKDFGQIVEEIPAKLTPAQIAATIIARTDQLVAEPRALAAAFVLPGVKKLAALTEMALALRTNARWHVDFEKLEPPPVMDIATVRIVRDLPFENKTLPSEALILGDFPIFPKTRRAPVTAFEIYVGEPAPQDPVKHTRSTKANFAHIDLRDRDLINRDVPQSLIKGMWDATRANRRISLGLPPKEVDPNADDNRAKAKVTFVIPMALATKMGCMS